MSLLGSGGGAKRLLGTVTPGDGPAATSSSYTEFLPVPRSESPTNIDANLSINVPTIRVDSGPPSSAGANSPDPEDEHGNRASTSTTALLLPAMPPRLASTSSDVRRAALIPLPPPDSTEDLHHIPSSSLRPALRANGADSSKTPKKSVNFGSSDDSDAAAPPNVVLARPDSAADGPGPNVPPIFDMEGNEAIMQGMSDRYQSPICFNPSPVLQIGCS